MPARCVRTPRLSRRSAVIRAAAGLLGGLGLLGSRSAAAQDAPGSPCLETMANESVEAHKDRATTAARNVVVPAFLVGGGQPVEATDAAALASVIEPAVQYILDPGKTTADAAVDKTIQNALYAYLHFQFPLYNLVVTGGKWAVSGGLYATEQLLAYGHDAQVLAILKGTEEAPLAGRIGNPLADAPLEQYSGMTAKGATIETLAVTFPKLQDLKAMWTGYVTQMWDARLNQSTVAYLQTQVWPMVEKLWMAQRLEISEAEIRAELKRQLELLCKPKGGGGLYRGQIPGEVNIALDAWGAETGLKAFVLHTCSAEVRLDPTSQPAGEGLTQNEVISGGLTFRAGVTHETTTSGRWSTEESFVSSEAQGTMYTSPEGAFGWVTFTGDQTILSSSDPSWAGPETATWPFPFGCTVDAAGQLLLCPSTLQETDLRTAIEACTANVFVTLQPVADDSSPPVA